MPMWIWQRPGWTDFRFEPAPLRALEDQYLSLSGQSIGLMQSTPPHERATIKAELLEDEAAKTSLIEGEMLDRISVRSSLRRQLGLSTSGRSRPREAGVAALMLNITETFDDPLDDTMLGRWNALAIADRKDIEVVGRYRTHSDEMQIISGPIGREKVHYVAPPSDAVPGLMAGFTKWFNASRSEVPAVTRAGIAHLWFETIHPFEDGNGRVGRAVALKALIGAPPIPLLSKTIHARRSAYYDALTAAQTNGPLQAWLTWFVEVVISAQKDTNRTIEFMRAKTRFLDAHSAALNPRQNKAVIRMFEEGPDGFRGGLSAENYRSITGATVPTTTRDLNQLVETGVLERRGERRYARYWLKI